VLDSYRIAKDAITRARAAACATPAIPEVAEESDASKRNEGTFAPASQKQSNKAQTLAQAQTIHYTSN